MNQTQAKILIFCENSATELRYAEYIAEKLEKDYNQTNNYLRRMELRGWISLAKSKHKKIVTSVSMTALQQAKEVLAKC